MEQHKSRMQGWKTLDDVLSLRSQVRDIELRSTRIDVFEVWHRNKPMITASISDDGLLLTSHTQPAKRATVANAIAAWAFIDDHIRNLLPRAQFEGEIEAELLQGR